VEADWLAGTDPDVLLQLLASGAGGSPLGRCSCCRTDCRVRGGLCPAYRRLRLFCCACCRRLLGLLPDPLCLSAIEAAEGYADGAIEEGAAVEAAHAFDSVRRSRFPKWHTPDDGAWNAVYCASHRRWERRFDARYAQDRWRLAQVVAASAADSAGEWEAAAQADLLREVFGNPSRPAPALAPSCLAWNDGTAVRLAQAAYENRLLPSGHLDLTLLGILADSLLDAGCTDAELLGHLRRPGPHVRGCHVLDLMLGKE
jgi:hypothetical protein